LALIFDQVTLVSKWISVSEVQKMHWREDRPVIGVSPPHIW